MSNIFEDWGLFSSPPRKPRIARRVVDGVCVAILVVPMALASAISWAAEKMGVE